jgi:acetoin utilization protein AcuB
MLVADRMTRELHTITPDTNVSEALNLMQEYSVRRFPVLDKRGHLVGIVLEKDLLYASPSPATSLSVYEIGYLLSKLKVEKVMSRDVITVAADAPLEEAARIMIDNKIGGLPVMEGQKLVGIITETDIFKVLLEMLGARESGVRITFGVHDEPGVLSKITGAIAELGGDIITLGTFCEEGADCEEEGILMIKVTGVEGTLLVKTMEEIGAKVQDVRAV